MSGNSNVENIRRGILRRLQIEYDYLHPGAQRRVDQAITRTRKYVERLDSGVRAHSPNGRAHARRALVGSADTVAGYMDGATKRKPPTKRRSKKQKRVVGKK